MRRANAIITSLIMILFLIHMIWGSLELAGMTPGGNRLFSRLSYLMVGLIVVHMVISMKLTWDTLRSQKAAGVSYRKANRHFWVRRISGMALMLFIALHVMVFRGRQTEEGYRLVLFNGGRLAVQLLMVAALMVHLLTNIRPLKIALGIEDDKGLRVDILLALAILLLLAAAAFVVYYLRWQMV